jgi:hypothetical protein
MEQAPGWKTSEFWLHLLFGLLISALTLLSEQSESLPPVPKAVVVSIGPVAIAWLTSRYNAGRVEVKKAALAADSVKSDADAVRVFNSKGPNP